MHRICITPSVSPSGSFSCRRLSKSSCDRKDYKGKNFPASSRRFLDLAFFSDTGARNWVFAECGVTHVVLIVQALEEKQKAAERALEEGTSTSLVTQMGPACSSYAQEKKDIEERLRSYVDIHPRTCHNTPALPAPLRLSEERKAAWSWTSTVCLDLRMFACVCCLCGHFLWHLRPIGLKDFAWRSLRLVLVALGWERAASPGPVPRFAQDVTSYHTTLCQLQKLLLLKFWIVFSVCKVRTV